MKAEPTRRPTFADFGAMLADEARDYGTALNDDGSLDAEQTTNNLIEAIGEIAEFFASTNISDVDLAALIDVVCSSAISAKDEAAQLMAKSAAKAMRVLIIMWGNVKDYRPEFWKFSTASNRYAQAIAKADTEEYLQGRQ